VKQPQHDKAMSRYVKNRLML